LRELSALASHPILAIRSPDEFCSKRVGIIGSLVWDVIYGRGPGNEPVEEWGGAGYSLSGLDAALDEDWQIVPSSSRLDPILADRRARFHGKPCEGWRLTRAPIEVPEPNNRVVLHYQSVDSRCERLSGGVPPWSWLGLKPLLSDLDALYIKPDQRIRAGSRDRRSSFARISPDRSTAICTR
jgi:hypothetical protein